MRLRLSLFALSLAASPASASSWQNLQRPSPCDHVIPTGLPLPRQAVANGTVNGATMIAVPNPTWRDKPVGLVGRDEPVTVLQECGWMLRIRNVRGLEGWINTTMLQDERKAYEAAKNRPPRSERDCSLLYLDPVVVDRCRIKLASERAHADELRNSVYYDGDELRRMVVGNTVRMMAPEQEPGLFYFSPEGELFLMRGAGVGGSGIRYRTRYAVGGDTISFTGKQLPDVRFRKTAHGLGWTAANGHEGTAEILPGDPASAVAEVTKWKPDPAAPVAPAGTEAIAGPKLH